MYTLKKLYSKERSTKYRKISNSPLPMTHTKQGSKEVKTMETAKTNGFQPSLILSGSVHPAKAYFNAASLRTNHLESIFTSLFSIPMKVTEYTGASCYRPSFFKTSALVIGLCTILCANSYASTPHYFNQVVDAIYKAEGGSKAKVPYGVLSVKVSSKEEARRVCYNTVRNNYTRWLKSGQRVSYLEFLASRYAPIGASNDPKGYNKNWLKNVKFFMEKDEKQGGRK